MGMCVCTHTHRLPWWLSSKESTCHCRSHGFNPWVPNGNQLKDSCLGNSMDRGAQRATVHRVAKELDMTQQLNNNNNGCICVCVCVCMLYVYIYACKKKGHGNSLQYSCLENPMDRAAWLATIHRVAQSDTTEATQHACMHKHIYNHQSPCSTCLLILFMGGDFCMQISKSSRNRNSFIFYFVICMPFISFFCSFALNRAQHVSQYIHLKI